MAVITVIENAEEEKKITNDLIGVRPALLVYEEIDPFLMIVPRLQDIPPEVIQLIGGTHTYGAA